MAFLPGHEIDVFISYAHLDNQLQWVSKFHRLLDIRLGEYLGEKPHIWRDPHISGHDYFEEKLVSNLGKTAIFLPILTPRYIKSSWCQHEYNTYLEAANSKGGIRLHNKSLIFKVIKTPISIEDHPEEIRNHLGYPFYEVENENGRIREYAADPDNLGFFTKLTDLAHDIHLLLRVIKESNKPKQFLSNNLLKTEDDNSNVTLTMNRELNPIREEEERVLVNAINTLLDREGGNGDSFSSNDFEFNIDLPGPQAEELLFAVKNGKFDSLNVVDASIIRTSTDASRHPKDTTLPRANSSAKKIFLAETTSDLSSERDKIRRELQQRGFSVLPDSPLPLQKSELIDNVRNDLRQSDLAIHLVGSSYGIVPENSDKSIVELQFNIASEVNEPVSNFRQLVWMPEKPGSNPIPDPRQKQFIDQIFNQPGGADLIQVSLEDIKTLIFDALDDLDTNETPYSTPDKPFVYLLYNPVDKEEIKPIYDHLFDEAAFAVEHPLFHGNDASRKMDHEDTLRNCDAVLIFYGNAPEAWVRSKLRDLRRIAGLGRDRPFQVTTVFIGDPESVQKMDFQTRLVHFVITHFGPIEAKALKPFIEGIQAQSLGV